MSPNPETRLRMRFPPGEGAQGLGFWVSSRPRGRGQNDDPGGLPVSGGATLGDLNREAREGWLSACFSLPQCLLPQLSKHSLEGQRRNVQLVPARLHAEAKATCMWLGTNAPFVAPRPCFLLSPTHGQTRTRGQQAGREQRTSGAGAGP